MTVCYELVSSTNQHYPMTTALPDDLIYLAETDDFMLFTSEAALSGFVEIQKDLCSNFVHFIHFYLKYTSV